MMHCGSPTRLLNAIGFIKCAQDMKRRPDKIYDAAHLLFSCQPVFLVSGWANFLVVAQHFYSVLTVFFQVAKAKGVLKNFLIEPFVEHAQVRSTHSPLTQRIVCLSVDFVW